MSNPLDHITLIIPVHQRQDTLYRILSYYKGFKCRKIVTDSSDQAWEGIKDFPEYEYDFKPGELYYRKCYHVLKTVKTKFVVDCGDDDFTLKESIIKCIEFLLTHEEYSIAFGEVIRFQKSTVEYDNPYIKAQYIKFASDNFYADEP